MKNLGNITKSLPKILLYIGLGAVLIMNIILAFVMLAPPEIYDPIYEKLWGSGETSAVTPTPEPAAEHGLPTEKPPAAIVEIRPGEGIMFDSGSKIVNLIDPTGRKYLRLGVVLEFAPTDLAYYTMAEEEKTLFEEEFNKEVSIKGPIINDAIITLVSSKSFDSVYTAEGKEELRAEILEKINEQIHELRVIYVYFTEFVVQ